MELWIRSQDKEDLVKAYNLRILNQSDIAVNVKFNMSRLEYLIIGKYSTKERALEVLDEIQEYINNNCEFIERKTHTKMGTYTDKKETYVYEMPEE